MNLIQALIHSENASNEQEAKALISEMQKRVDDGEDPEEILTEIGLEPDYVMDILGF